MDTLQQLQSLRSSLPPSTAENVALREQLLVEARKLANDLERPDNVLERLGFGFVELAAIRAAMQMGLFNALDKATSSTPQELARTCNADEDLVARLLRCLASYGAVEQIDADHYVPATTSRVLSNPRRQSVLMISYDFLQPGWRAIPRYLDEKKWQTPASSTDTSMAKGWDIPDGATFFEILKQHGPLDHFNIWMKSFNEGRKNWLDVYPAMERLGQGAEADPSAVMMVDVGGGYGQQAIGLKERCPGLPGRFIVQDLPQGLPPADQRPSNIEFMVHDFNDEQPVKGARLYYLRYINHSWSQSINIHFCTQLRKAMKKGYSRLVINEWVVPDVGASRLMTAMDLTMMSIGGGMERTLGLHREYLEKAGLKITKVYSPGDNISESVIEAEVA